MKCYACTCARLGKRSVGIFSTLALSCSTLFVSWRDSWALFRKIGNRLKGIMSSHRDRLRSSCYFSQFLSKTHDGRENHVQQDSELPCVALTRHATELHMPRLNTTCSRSRFASAALAIQLFPRSPNVEDSRDLSVPEYTCAERSAGTESNL